MFRFAAVLCVGFLWCASAVFDVRKYGAVGDGQTSDTKAMRAATAALWHAGGGTLLIPPGMYKTGPINISSNADVLILGQVVASAEEDWPVVDVTKIWPQVGQGDDCNIETDPRCGDSVHQPFIFAWDAANITIRGNGTIDGQGQQWWNCRCSDTTVGGIARCQESPCRGLSRPFLLMLSNVSHVRVYGITTRNSPFWNMHFSWVTHLHVSGVYVYNPVGAPNGDGIDIDSTQDVLIEDSVVSVNDDSICVKSGNNYNGRKYNRSSRDILVRNVTIGRGGGMAVGSDGSGSVYNVTFENITLHGTNRIVNIKTQRGRGGEYNGIVYRNIIASKIVHSDIGISEEYHFGLNATNRTATPRIRNLLLENVTIIDNMKTCDLGFMIGLPESPLENVTLRDVHMPNGTWSTCRYVNGGVCEGSTNMCPPCFESRQGKLLV